MVSRIVTGIMIIVLGALFVSGCASREQRIQKIQTQYPQWDRPTVEKVASKKVEIGMTPEMVKAALGRPDAISREGDEEKWGYAINVEYGMGGIYRELVYFVYLKKGKVVRTAGNWSRLGYWFY